MPLVVALAGCSPASVSVVSVPVPSGDAGGDGSDAAPGPTLDATSEVDAATGRGVLADVGFDSRFDADGALVQCGLDDALPACAAAEGECGWEWLSAETYCERIDVVDNCRWAVEGVDAYCNPLDSAWYTCDQGQVSRQGSQCFPVVDDEVTRAMRKSSGQPDPVMDVDRYGFSDIFNRLRACWGEGFLNEYGTRLATCSCTYDEGTPPEGNLCGLNYSELKKAMADGLFVNRGRHDFCLEVGPGADQLCPGWRDTL